MSDANKLGGGAKATIGRGADEAGPRFQCYGHECGFQTEDAEVHAAHMGTHGSARTFAWVCPCGTFGEGRKDVPMHNAPRGALCTRAMPGPLASSLMELELRITALEAK